MTDTPTLEPCPWCGEDVELLPFGNESASVECYGDTCGASGPTRETRSAAQAWNEVASAARKWRKAAKITWHDPASGGRPDRVNLWPAPTPDRPTCSAPACARPAIYMRKREAGTGLRGFLCGLHTVHVPARHYEPITPPTQLMTDQPTAFHIKADIYKAEPCDRERASGPSVALSADNDSVHCVDRDGTKSCFPRAAIPAIREALRQLQENPNE